jgi:hypothetical protein
MFESGYRPASRLYAFELVRARLFDRCHVTAPRSFDRSARACSASTSSLSLSTSWCMRPRASDGDWLSEVLVCFLPMGRAIAQLAEQTIRLDFSPNRSTLPRDAPSSDDFVSRPTVAQLVPGSPEVLLVRPGRQFDAVALTECRNISRG